MYTNAAPITRFVNNVTELLNRIGYDTELAMLCPAHDSTAWTVALILAAHESSTTHRRYRFSFQATPCDTAGDECDIANLSCASVGLHGARGAVLELVAAARAAMMEALDNPEDGAVTTCGYAELAKALTWAMVDAGEETVIARFMR